MGIRRHTASWRGDARLLRCGFVFGFGFVLAFPLFGALLGCAGSRRPDPWRTTIVGTQVDLQGLEVSVRRVRGCAPTSTIETPAAMEARGCKVRRGVRSLPLALVGADGRRTELGELSVGRDGRAHVDFLRLDTTLTRAGEMTLWSFAYLVVGPVHRPAGVRLGQLGELRRLWHREWALQGRASPRGYLAQRGSEEALADAEVQALALEAELAHQYRDYLDVAAGRLLPSEFLERYPWSPYRYSVRRMALAAEPQATRKSF